MEGSISGICEAFRYVIAFLFENKAETVSFVERICRIAANDRFIRLEIDAVVTAVVALAVVMPGGDLVILGAGPAGDLPGHDDGQRLCRGTGIFQLVKGPDLDRSAQHTADGRCLSRTACKQAAFSSHFCALEPVSLDRRISLSPK